MGRPARKIEARESVESRIKNAVAYAFGAPEVKLFMSADRASGHMMISLGMLDGEEIWIELPFTVRREPISTIHDEDE